MNGKNAWDHKVDAAMFEGPVGKVSRKEVRGDQEDETGKGCKAL